MKTPNAAVLLRCADWHGEQAAKAYRENDMGAYVRHVSIADRLWSPPLGRS
jgi:hypothetical protein